MKNTDHLQTPAVRAKRNKAIKAAFRRKKKLAAAALPPVRRALKAVKTTSVATDRPMFERVLALLEAIWRTGR